MKNLIFCLGLLLSVVLPASLFAKQAAACDQAVNSFSSNSFIHAELPAKHFSLEGCLVEVEDDEISDSEKSDLIESHASSTMLTAFSNYAAYTKQFFTTQQAANPALPIFILIKVFRL
jgi:hypothetical protein